MLNATVATQEFGVMDPALGIIFGLDGGGHEVISIFIFSLLGGPVHEVEVLLEEGDIGLLFCFLPGSG